MTLGRPSSFTQETADVICERIAGGASLRSICREEGMPSQTTVFRWLRDQADFREQYARARDDQAEAIFDEMLEIADDGRRDYTVDEEGRMLVDHDHIQRAKLRVDSRKWVLGKLKPKKYGERIEHELSGSVNQQTDAQLDSRIALLLAKTQETVDGDAGNER